MKYNQNLNINNTRKSLGVTERQAPPLLTMMLLVLTMLTFYFYQSANGPTWIMRNTFQMEQIVNLINTQKYGQIVSMLYTTNFANVNFWQMGPAIYFMCLFGIPVEKRLGPSRYIGLILLACTLPWLVQFLDLSYFPTWPLPMEHPKQDHYFFGLYSITLALAGAYSILMPKKAADLSNSRLYRKDRTQIFNTAEVKAMNEKFGFAPNVFFTAFIVYAFASHYVTSFFFKEYDTIGLFAGVVALSSGYIMASLIHLGLEDSFADHPLKHAAIKSYYELLDLDVNHDNAVKGASKGLGLPEYQVEDWVKKNKGKLRST